MARPREFDIDMALAKALDVFWQRGYEEASLPDLLTGMELTRGSLYKAFGDKKSLFLKVLSRYDEKAVGNAVTLLSTPGADGWARITQLFQQVTDAVAEGDRRGCLLCSAAAGPASYDSEIGAMVETALGRMQQGFCTAIAQSTRPDDAEALAHFLVNQYVGHRIMARTGVPLAHLRQSISALAHLSR